MIRDSSHITCSHLIHCSYRGIDESNFKATIGFYCLLEAVSAYHEVLMNKNIWINQW